MTLTLEMIEKLKGVVRDVVTTEIANHAAPAATAPSTSPPRAFAEAARAMANGAADDQRRDASPEKGSGAAQIVRALCVGKGDPERAARFVRRSWGENYENIARALETGADSAGGYVVPPNYSAEIIELLYPMTVVRGSGAIVAPMENGTLTMPKLTGGAQAGYIGENQNIPISQQDLGDLNLVWKKLACIVPISNDLVRFSNPSVDRIVRDDLLMSLALREDLAFIRDDGTEYKPKGLRYWARPTNVIAMTDSTTPTLPQVRGDLSKLQLALEAANSRLLRPGWILTPRTKHYLLNLADGNGNFAYKTEMDNGMLYGYPFKVTTQVPNNLGAGSNESELYFVDYSDCVIGESSELVLDASSEAAYHDGTSVQAAFSRDQTLIRAIARHDFGMRHDFSVAVGTGVKWGA